MTIFWPGPEVVTISDTYCTDYEGKEREARPLLNSAFESDSLVRHTARILCELGGRREAGRRAAGGRV